MDIYLKIITFRGYFEIFICHTLLKINRESDMGEFKYFYSYKTLTLRKYSGINFHDYDHLFRLFDF